MVNCFGIGPNCSHQGADILKMVEGHISQQTQPTKFNIKIFCLSFASQQFLLTFNLNTLSKMSNFNLINNINNNNLEFPMKEPSLHAWITKHYLLSDNQIGEMTKIIEIKMNWAYFSANQFWLTYVSLKNSE